MIKVIASRLSESITTVDIAGIMRMSESHIGRQFKAQTGKTVTQYINEVKVAEAKRLLDFDELTVTENAMQLGFSSQSYFQTVFKKITSYAGHLIRALHSHF